MNYNIKVDFNEEIVTCHCPHCGDSFVVTDEVLGVSSVELPMEMDLDEWVEMPEFKSVLNWWMTEKDCWNCKKNYKPHLTGIKMFPEVFKSLKKYKM